jgi:DnaJ-class molecular chaperone
MDSCDLPAGHDPEDLFPCPKCGGDGFMALSDCPELWGEDTFAEQDREVVCPECGGSG